MTENILSVHNLVVKYDKALALDKITFSIQAKQCVGLLGSNGAGKSTLMNTITGIIEASAGEILYNDLYLNMEQPFASIGFSPQTQVMDWYTTVWDNVMLGLALAGKKGEEAKQLCEEALNVVALLDKKDKIVDGLSGGQQQRVQIARAIAHKPNIYILDEPTTGLDAESADKLFAYLKYECAQGKAVFVSSHDIQLLEHFCEMILFLKQGEQQYFGNITNLKKETTEKVQITIKESLTKKEMDWLEEWRLSSKVVSKTQFEVYLKDEEFIVDIINQLAHRFEIVGINSKRSDLREIYLDQVK